MQDSKHCTFVHSGFSNTIVLEQIYNSLPLEGLKYFGDVSNLPTMDQHPFVAVHEAYKLNKANALVHK
jgi:hypothetical protein